MTDNPKLVELRFNRLIRLAIWTRRNSASTSVSTSVSTSFSSSNMTLLKRSFPASTEVGGFPTCMCTPLPWPLVCVVLRGFFRGVVAVFALAALLLFLAAPAVRINVPENSSKGWGKGSVSRNVNGTTVLVKRPNKQSLGNKLYTPRNVTSRLKKKKKI